MIEAIKKDLRERFADIVSEGKMTLAVAYTNCREKAEDFARQIKEEIPNLEIEWINPLSLSVSCHIGSGALAVACSRKID